MVLLKTRKHRANDDSLVNNATPEAIGLGSEEKRNVGIAARMKQRWTQKDGNTNLAYDVVRLLTWSNLPLV